MHEDMLEVMLEVMHGQFLQGLIARWRRAYSIVIYSTWWHLPSKTLCEIEMLMELLHSAAEGYQSLSWILILAPWLPDGSQMPLRWLPDASQMAPRCLPDAFQMPLIRFPGSSSLNPSLWFLFYESSPMSSLQWFFFHDSSPMFPLAWLLPLDSFSMIPLMNPLPWFLLLDFSSITPLPWCLLSALLLHDSSSTINVRGYVRSYVRSYARPNFAGFDCMPICPSSLVDLSVNMSIQLQFGIQFIHFYLHLGSNSYIVCPIQPGQFVCKYQYKVKVEGLILCMLPYPTWLIRM